jgi:signal transduction protein with GAF and PtsI domain
MEEGTTEEVTKEEATKEEGAKEAASSRTTKPATGLAIRASQIVSRAATTTSSLVANATAVTLGNIPSVPDAQLQEHDPIRLQDFLSLRDTDVDGIASTSDVSSATTSSKNSVISCDSDDMGAEVDWAQLSPEEREKHMEMLRKRRVEKKHNAVIDLLDGAFGPTVLLCQGVEGRDKAERVLKRVSNIGERTGLAKMSDESMKEASPDLGEEENEKGKEVDVPEEKKQD